MKVWRSTGWRDAAAAALVLAGCGAAWAAGEDGIAKAREAAAALVRGNAGQALTLYSEALADPGLTTDRRAGILNDRGVVYGRLSQPKLAIDDFNRALQLFPESAQIYNNRGNTLLALGHVKEAVKDFDRAILLAPGYAAAYNNRAGALVRLGQTADAIRDFTRSIELSPAAAPLGGRGRALMSEGRPHAALRDFNRALAADGRFAPGYRARAEAKLAIERYDEAVEDLSRAVAFEPGSAELMLLRGRAYLLAGSAVSAIKDLTRAIELDPRSAAAYEQRGLAHAKAEAFEEADADLAKAIELNPRSAVAFAYRAVLYKWNGQPEVGAREVEKAQRIDAGRPEVAWARAEIAEARGAMEEAKQAYRAVVAAAPWLKEAGDGLERLGVAGAAEQVDVPGAGLDPWSVVQRGNRFFAVSASYPRLQVPLEMAGSGQPKLLEWDVKKAPYTGIGTLRFFSGMTAGGSAPEETEQVAILDLTSRAIVGIEPHRVGTKVATWEWEDGRVVVASVDGVKDEFILRGVSRTAAVQQGSAGERPAGGGSGGAGYGKGETPEWAPWAGKQYGGTPGQQRQAARPQKKPKTLFDLLFGN